MIGVYFDAKSHYATEIDGENIETIKIRIETLITQIRIKENLHP
jgi:hypothetical protein